MHYDHSPRGAGVSAIATSYKITEKALSEGLELLNRNEHEKFWQFMEAYEVATLPYSGYVLAAVIPFAQLKGVELPSGQGTAAISDSQQRQLGMVACGNRTGFGRGSRHDRAPGNRNDLRTGSASRGPASSLEINRVISM